MDDTAAELASEVVDSNQNKSPSGFFVTVDVVLFAGSAEHLSVLLVERGSPPFAGALALPGGFVDLDEPLAEAASRELLEETSIRVSSDDLVQVGAYGNPGRDPRGRTITVAFWSVSSEPISPQAGSDAARARFVLVDELAPGDLAFDHDLILGDAIGCLRRHGAGAG